MLARKSGRMRVENTSVLPAYSPCGDPPEGAKRLETAEPNNGTPTLPDGQHPGSDMAWGDSARDVSARATDPNAPRYSYSGVHMEHPGDADDARMRANREAGELAVTTAEVTIVVQGWLMPSNDLWVSKIGQPVSIYSPMLFPDDSATLYMRGCTHRQSDGGGTETEMAFCKKEALGALPQASYGTTPGAFGTSTPAAAPDGLDTRSV